MSFARYPTYRDSGISWLGEVPAHWGLTKVKHSCTFTTGWTPPTGNSASYDGENLWANISDLGPRVLDDTAKRISDEAIDASGIALSPSGSLLFSFKLSIGQVSFAGRDMYTNEAIATFRGSPHLSLRFAYYAFPLFLVQNAAENIYGAKLLNQELIRNAALALPSIEEQAAIAGFLDRETSKIDALIAEQEKLIELLKEKRRALISHAVTKGLNPNAPMKDSGIEWLGQVPAHWEVAPFRYCVSYVEGPGIMASDFRTQGTPLLRVSCVQGRWVTLNGCNFLDPSMANGRWAHFKVAEGDLLISASATMGTVAEVKADAVGSIPYTGLIRLRGIAGRMLRDFIRAYVVCTSFIAQIDLLKTGSTIQHFGPTHLSQIRLACPPVDEQDAIARHVDKVSSTFHQLISEAGRAIALLKERRAALISAAVTGKIDVRGAPWQ